MTVRAIRNNNPGNIETGAPWDGLMPRAQMNDDQLAETRFCVFSTPAHGIRAMCRILITYHDKRLAGDGSKIDTIRETIERWAPVSENDVDAYVRRMRTVTGLDADQVLDFKDWNTMRMLVLGIITHEIGFQPYDDAVIDKGLVLAGIEPPARDLSDSRTVRGGKWTIGAILAGLAERIAASSGDIKAALGDVAPYLPSIGYVLAGVSIVTVGWMLYARWDDSRRGLR